MQRTEAAEVLIVGTVWKITL